MSLTDAFSPKGGPVKAQPHNDVLPNATPRHRKYAEAALAGRCATLAATSEGTRNAALNEHALIMAHMVCSGWIGESTVRNDLLSAAKRAGLGEHEATKTFDSGFDAGVGTPADEPQASPGFEGRTQANRLRSRSTDDTGVVETRYNSADDWDVHLELPDQQYLGGPAEEFEAKPLIALESVSEIFAQLPPVNWLCKDLQLAPGRPNLLAGPGYGGKSIIAQVIGFAVASGQRVFGKFPVQQGKVIHLNYDQGGRVPKSRYQRIMRAQLMAPSDLEGRLFIGNHPPVYLDDPGAEAALMVTCEGAALLIIDSFRAALRTLDENDSRVRGPLNMLIRVSEKTGVTVLVIHHSRKPGIGATAGKNEIRGSSAIFEACESVYVLDPVKGEPTRVMHEKAGITGMTRKDFLLHVADIEIDGAARGGLMVTVEDVVTVDLDVRATQARLGKVAKLREEIAALFGSKGDQKGTELVASLLGRRVPDVRRVINLMIAEGEVLDLGKGKARVLHYVGKQPVTTQTNGGSSEKQNREDRGTDT